MAGCVPAAPQHGAWPWNTKNDYDMKQTGTFIAATAGVAQFGDVPKAVKPVTPETIAPPRGGNASAEAPYPAAKSEAKFDPFSLSPTTMPRSNKTTAKAAEYDFSLQVITAAPLSHLPVDIVAPEYPVIAFNRGVAPVSLTFDIDSPSRQRWSADKPLPLYTVVPPNTELVVAHLKAKTKYDPGSIRSSYSWALGDYSASHSAAEHYQFPFPKTVKAVASVSTDDRTSPVVKHSVTFIMPVGTPILAARKGTVMRIKGSSKVDVLHDDSTIASYEHLGEINPGISVGSVVLTEDSIGTVGALGKEKNGYLQLTVWRPEPRAPASPKAGSPTPGFDSVSLPLEFCSPNFKGCRALANDQTVSRGALLEKKGKRGGVGR